MAVVRRLDSLDEAGLGGEDGSIAAGVGIHDEDTILVAGMLSRGNAWANLERADLLRILTGQYKSTKSNPHIRAEIKKLPGIRKLEVFCGQNSDNGGRETSHARKLHVVII